MKIKHKIYEKRTKQNKRNEMKGKNKKTEK